MQKPRRCNNIWSNAWFTSQLIQSNIYLTIFTVVHSLNQAYLLMAFKVTVQLLKFLKQKELFLSESNSRFTVATSSFGSLSTLPIHLLPNWGCVTLRWSGSGSPIRDHSDHGKLNEPMNLCPEWIHRFIWSTTIRVVSDHWSWSGSSQRKAPWMALTLESIFLRLIVITFYHFKIGHICLLFFTSFRRSKSALCYLPC